MRIVELIRVTDPLMRHKLEKLAAERVTIAGGEVREGHLEGAADLRIEVVNLARESIGRQPFRHRIGIEKRAIDPLRLRPKHAVQSNRVWHGVFLSALSLAPLPSVQVASRGHVR